MSKENNMELLAPAGDMTCALAAFDAGADAVYGGLKKFNARARSGNFTLEEYGSLIRYAHENGKKVYTTFNTVLRESEIPEAADFLAELACLHPDAVIVQDIGVIRMIREYFPDLTIHGSTQMALHNRYDLEMAASMGIRRVILERQTTLEELRLLAEHSPVELEVFVHGALCCCLSGSCLLSSWFGGASGNRGKCKQPCRRLFRNDRGKEGFFLSTGDLAAYSLIPRFRQMGIASLKIEGRLRKPDYVTKVTKAYRMILDASEKDFPEAVREAGKLFAQTPSRFPSVGFYTPEAAKKVIRSNEAGGLGQYCGKVSKVFSGGIETVLAGRIHVGDFLRVQADSGDTGSMFCVLSLSVNGQKKVKAFPGERCRIAVKDVAIPRNGILYRIGEASSKMERRISNLPVFKMELEMALSLTAKSLQITFPRFRDMVWQYPLSLACAEKHPFEEKHLAEAFHHAGELPFLPVCRSVKVDGKFFFPGSLLKEVKRQFKAWCNETFTEEILKKPFLESKERLKKDHASFTAPSLPSGAEKKILTEKDAPFILPFFVPETECRELEKKIFSMVEENNADELYIPSAGWLFLKRKYPHLKLTVFPPLPLANSFAAAEFASAGASAGVIHTELGREDMCLLAEKSPLMLYLYAEGHPVLFATRGGMEKTEYLAASDGERFFIRRSGAVNILYAERKLLLPEEIPHTVPLYDRMIKNGEEGEEKGTSEFNFYRGLS